MDATSVSSSRFRFRDHDQQLADGEQEDESSQGHTSADSSSVSAYQDEEDEPDLQSMTAKGVQYLCSELVELKQESDEEFHKDIFSNCNAFIAILKEIQRVQLEILGLEKLASSQKSLIDDVIDGISLRVLSDDTSDSMLEEEEEMPDQQSSPSILETHTENVSDILDNLLSVHKLDDALALLEMEDEFLQNLTSEESFSTEQLMAYSSVISEKRAMLSQQFMFMAKHPRVHAPELQKALLGLCQLGDSHLATRLLIQYYHSRITSSIRDLQFGNHVDVSHLQEAAKCIISAISQAAKSFVSLNGGTYSYPLEVIQWAGEELQVFAACFHKYIGSISEVNSRLSTTVKAAKIAISYCSLMENQKMFLQPDLMAHIRPCIEEVLQTHIDHLKEVISIVTSTDDWLLGRYFVSGILTGGNCAIIDQQPECYFLTNSGRKFVTLIQSFTEDISPLITMQMGSSVLKGVMDLFTAYDAILERALCGDAQMMQEEVSITSLPESLTQQAAILVNLSTLMQFYASIIRNTFDGFSLLDAEIDKHQSIHLRLKTHFLETFVSDVFSSTVGDDYGRERSISWQKDSTIYDLIPSVPYLELYLELKKLHKLIDDDCIDIGQVNSFMKEIMEAALLWISNKSEIHLRGREKLHDRRVEFLQSALDTQFLIEIARSGGYLTDLMMDLSSHIISGLEDPFTSAGLDPLRDTDDDEWPANAAVLALVKLQELQETESQENDYAGNRGLNHSSQEAGNSQGENNASQKSQEISLQLIHNPVYEGISDVNNDTALIEGSQAP